MVIYFTYSFAVLIHWLLSLRQHRDPMGWIVWWGSYGLEMMIPTLPSSFSLGPMLRLEPEWLLGWLSSHPPIDTFLTWAWIVFAGYLQWFIAVPFLWSRFKPKGHSVAA